MEWEPVPERKALEAGGQVTCSLRLPRWQKALAVCWLAGLQAFGRVYLWGVVLSQLSFPLYFTVTERRTLLNPWAENVSSGTKQ